MILKQDFLVLNNTVMRFFGVKQCLNEILYDIKMSRISSSISNFFILNGEILTEPIRDFLILVFLKQFLIPRFQDCLLFQPPMPELLHLCD
jgi:hypothetical protein